MNRRDFLRRGAVVGSAAALGSQAFLRPLLGGVGAGAGNLVVVELIGGNDGFNTIVPYGVDGGVYQSVYRPSLGIAEPKVLKIPGQPVGFHPALAPLKSHFDAGRLAVVQGVSTPDPSFSHVQARRVWRSADPTGIAGEGWLGRYLARYPAPSFPKAAEVFDSVTHLTAGAPGVVAALKSVNEYKFPIDPLHPEEGALRRYAFTRIADAAASQGGSVGAAGVSSSGLLDLIDGFKTVPGAPAGAYAADSFAQALKVTAQLLDAGLGLSLFHVGLPGFDTHTDQNKNGFHAGLLTRLANGLAAFHADLVQRGLDQQTLVLVGSEFGRSIVENASGGCDHGTVSPALVFGGPVVGGVVNPHPSLAPSSLDEHGEPPMAVDLRDVLGTILTAHLGESPAAAAEILLGHAPTDLGFVKT